MNSRRVIVTLIGLAGIGGHAGSVAAAPDAASGDTVVRAGTSRCTASASGAPPIVVELYTSEGCSSCPPADRWLSSLKGRPGVLALAFHVDYWDGLGWRDRFATPAFTQRQRELVRLGGERTVYTPQVRVDGKDWRGWPRLPAAAIAPPGPGVVLRREGSVVSATVAAWRAALSGYWAWVEDGHLSRVRAGENSGETLKHDHVVRRYEPLPTWDARQARVWRWDAGSPPADASRPGRVIFVLTDPESRRPLQAVELAC